jgi:hypothetical protein
MSSHQIYEFDGVALPLYQQVQDLGAGAVASSLARAVGGAYDWSSTRRRLPVSQQFTVSGVYAAELNGDTLVDDVGDTLVDESANVLVTHGALADLRAQVGDLKSRIGVRGTLRRRRFDNTAVIQTRTVRLLDVRERGDIDERGMRAQIDCVFEADRVGWRSATQRTADISANGLVDVYGNLPVRNAVLTITASSTITRVDVRNVAQGVDLCWIGSLASGSLTINAEAQTVTANGANSYSGFVLGSSHTALNWLALDPGPNVIEVLITGTASAVSLAWWDVWA